MQFDVGYESPYPMAFIPEWNIRKVPTMWYLAGPYSSKESGVTEQRMQQFLLADYKLLKAGWRTVSPLSKHFCLHMGEEPIDGTYNFWGEYSRHLLSLCGGIIILTIDGWEASTGLTDEHQFAKENHKEIVFYNPEEDPPEAR